MDLSLVPIQDLYQEILNRFDHMIIVGRKDIQDSFNCSYRFKGDYHTGMGLCLEGYERIKDRLKKDREEIETDEL